MTAIASSSALPKASEFLFVVGQVLTLVEWIPACRPQSRIVDLSVQCCEVLWCRSSEHPYAQQRYQVASTLELALFEGFSNRHSLADTGDFITTTGRFD